MSEARQTRGSRIENKKPVIIGLAVVVSAAGLGGLAHWWQISHTQPKLTPLQQAFQQSQQSNLDGDFKAAHEEVTKALKANNLTDYQKYQLYTQQAATYANEANYQQSLENYQKAAAYQENQGLYAVMAQTAELAGDKEAAIKYYKKAISLIPNSSPVAGDDKESYEQRITELGGEP